MIMPKDKRNSETELANSLSKSLRESLDEASKKLNDDSAEGALARGKVFQMAAYFKEAAQCYADALAQDDDLDEAAARLVVAQLKGRQPEKALASAMNIAARKPGFEVKELSSNQVASAMTLLGDALVHNNRPTDAIEAYRAARTESKRDAFAAGRLAQLLIATGEPKKALEQAKGVAANPRFRDLSRVLALGERNVALLPSFRTGSLIDMIALTDHGRPLFVDGTARSATLAWGDDQWCADIADLDIK
jgi:tetratricopeptide (TPR) repeat protein